MKASDPNSFANFHKNEPKTAAYVGYNTIGLFRQMRFHPVCLYWYVAFDTYCSGRGAKIPMSILQDKVDRGCFGEDLSELLRNYPIRADEQLSRDERTINNANQDHVYAGMFFYFSMKIDTISKAHVTTGILYYMAANLETFVLPADYDHIAIKTCFEKLLPPGGSLPEVDGLINPPSMGPFFVLDESLLEVAHSIKHPKLGHFVAWGECELERYSRVNCILKLLRRLTAPSCWADFSRSADKFPSLEIHSSSIPVWMRDGKAIEPMRLFQEPVTQESPMHMEVS